VTIARERLRYMDQTIAVLLALVGVKLLAAGSCTSARWKASRESSSCSRSAPRSRCARARRIVPNASPTPEVRRYSSPTWRRIDNRVGVHVLALDLAALERNHIHAIPFDSLARRLGHELAAAERLDVRR